MGKRANAATETAQAVRRAREGKAGSSGYRKGCTKEGVLGMKRNGQRNGDEAEKER